MSTRLFVGNLSYRTTAEDLRKAFGHFGTVTQTQIMPTPGLGMRNFGVVEMAEGSDAAIAGLNGSQFLGRTLTVNEPGASRKAEHASEPIGQHREKRDVEGRGYRTVTLIDQSQTLQTLGGDSRGPRPRTPVEDRADVARFEDEGGTVTGEGAESAHDQHDRETVAEAGRLGEPAPTAATSIPLAGVRLDGERETCG
jgi:cold-inducible RNA-binding protein